MILSERLSREGGAKRMADPHLAVRVLSMVCGNFVSRQNSANGCPFLSPFL